MKKETKTENWEEQIRELLDIYYDKEHRAIWESRVSALINLVASETKRARGKVFDKIKDGLIRNVDGILLTGGYDNFVVVDSFLEFLTTLRKSLEKEERV